MAIAKSSSQSEEGIGAHGSSLETKYTHKYFFLSVDLFKEHRELSLN